MYPISQSVRMVRNGRYDGKSQRVISQNTIRKWQENKNKEYSLQMRLALRGYYL